VCGVVGVTGSCESSLIDGMLSVVASRGPDGSERFDEPGLHFGFARLSINDLSATGNQPMFSENQRFVSMMNGEIYNAPELRRTLESRGRRFKGNSDAEVIPHGYAEWGNGLFARLRGMFAIAVFDRTMRRLSLARDHFGIKPLYYAPTQDGVCFSSSARAVSLHPQVGQTLNPKAVSEFLRFRYVKSGLPMYLAVQTVQPGQIVICDGRSIEQSQYWSRPRFSDSTVESSEDLIEKFSSLLKSSVKRELLSDVPLGVLLSGGIDSAAVLQAAVSGGAKNLIAYTYDMSGDASEVREASQIARAHGVEHRVVESSNHDFIDTYTKAIQCMDLPVGDAIVGPTYQLLSVVRSERKAVLTGEGADELMAGYAHVAPLRWLGRLSDLGIHRSLLATVTRLTPWRVLDAYFPYEASLGKSGKAKVVEIIRSSDDPATALDNATSMFAQSDFGIDQSPPSGVDSTLARDFSLSTLIDWGFESWLPNQILNKMDQLSMAHGVEARVPFVDVDLYEYVSTLPTQLLLSRKGNKRVLRETLKKWGYPGAERPKRAFFKPVTEQHRRELKTLAREWLSPATTRRHAVINDVLVSRALEKLDQGDFLAAKQVATMAALHIWLEQDFRR